jgi:hypothetical protein
MLPASPDGFDLDTHMSLLYTFFREEFVIFLERLHFLQIESMLPVENIEHPPYWGQLSSNWATLNEYFREHLDFKNIIDVNQDLDPGGLKDNIYRNDLFYQSFTPFTRIRNWNFGNLQLINKILSTSFNSQSQFVNKINELYGPTFEKHADLITPEEVINVDKILTQQARSQEIINVDSTASTQNSSVELINVDNTLSGQDDKYGTAMIDLQKPSEVLFPDIPHVNSTLSEQELTQDILLKDLGNNVHDRSQEESQDTFHDVIQDIDKNKSSEQTNMDN